MNISESTSTEQTNHVDINDVPGVTRVGEFKLGTKHYSGKRHVYHPCKLSFVVDTNLSNNLYTQKKSIVYFVVVDDVIKKIGKTSGTGGIKSCINFYCSAGQGDDGPNRFAINWMIREEIQKKNKVEIYMKYLEPICINVQGLFGSREEYAVIDPACMEQLALTQYKEIVGTYPDWNFQECNEPIPRTIQMAHSTYKNTRQEERNK